MHIEVWHILFFLLPLTAFMYASVGHGGASSYLMFLALFGFAPDQIRPAALLLNMVVSFIAFMNFNQKVTFPVKLFIPLIVFSMPAAYLGGTLMVNTVLYKQILGVLLIFPIIRFLIKLPQAQSPIVEKKLWLIATIGLSIGFFSGLIGIGGGIILSPILLMLGWTDLRETAAVSALFIFLNSITGYWGAAAWNVQIDGVVWALMPLTILAGAAGAFFGASRFNLQVVRYVLTSVLAFASVKLLFG